MLRIYLDLETYRITEETITPQPVCMSWTDGNEDGRAGIVHARDPRFWSLLSGWLSDPDVEIVWHNGFAFDVPVLVAHAPDQERIELLLSCMEEGRMTDTLIRAWLGDTAEGKFRGFSRRGDRLIKHGYGLADLARLAGLPDMAKGEDTWRLRYDELDRIPLDQWPKEAIDYSKLDVVNTAKVCTYQDIRWGDEVLADQYEQFRGYFALSMMSAHGLYTDPERVSVYEKMLLERRDSLEDKLVARGLIEKKVIHRGKENERTEVTCKQTPTRELYGKLCEEYGLDPVLTETGQFSVTEETVGELHGANPGYEDEELELLSEAVEYKHSKQLLSRDVRVLKWPIVRTKYGWAGTGRVTSSRSNIVQNYANLQNQAKKGMARECYVPPPGYLLCSSDFEQAELVAVADICRSYFGSSRLGDLINQGVDVHNRLASSFTGKQMTGKSRERDACKMGNFGLWGGMGDATFDANLKKAGFKDISGARLRGVWKQDNPESKDYFHRASEIIDNCDGMVEVYGGGMWRKVQYFTQACNTPFQNLVARISKRSAWYLIAATLRNELPIIPMVQVHDEFLFGVPDHLDTAGEVAKAATSLMIQGANDFLRHTVMRAEPALMRRWYKAASAVYDARGRLIPWEPNPAR